MGDRICMVEKLIKVMERLKIPWYMLKLGDGGGGWNFMETRRCRCTMLKMPYNSNSISTRIQDMFYQSRQI